jgi:pimeloyl-ACP methyl ester carboxylesterase
MPTDCLVASDPTHLLTRALQAHAAAQAGTEPALTAVLDACAVRHLLAARAGGHELPALLLGSKVQASRLRLVVDYRDFSAFCRIASLAQWVQDAVEEDWGHAVALQMFVLGNGFDTPRVEPPGEPPGVDAPPSFERLVAALAELVFEARRREESHFDRVALTLPDETDGAVHLLDADVVADLLALRCDELPGGATVLYGLPLCTKRDLVQAIAEVAGVPVRSATGALPMDAVGELMRHEISVVFDREALGREAELAARADRDVSLQALAPKAAIDWKARVKAVVAPLRASHDALQAPRFDALPRLARCCAADRTTHYLRHGEGATALLLVNAFGLPLDVWYEVVHRLPGSVRVLTLCGSVDASVDAGDRADPYYGTPDAPARFVRAVQAVLAAEGLAACHVASWCGGSKYALELARRIPESIASLALLAPSFAGEQVDGAGAGGSGGDSQYEASLATMCRVAVGMPGAAAGMARSMQAMLARGAQAGPVDDEGSGANLFAQHDRLTAPWLHAPFESADSMVAYSRQLLAFRAHRVAQPHDEPRLQMPLMLVTGAQDSVTNNQRARALLDACGAVVHFELQRAGHYFIHQNAAHATSLLLDFLQRGTRAEPSHPRVRRVAEALEPLLVSGEL